MDLNHSLRLAAVDMLCLAVASMGIVGFVGDTLIAPTREDIGPPKRCQVQFMTLLMRSAASCNSGTCLGRIGLACGSKSGRVDSSQCDRSGDIAIFLIVPDTFFHSFFNSSEFSTSNPEFAQWLQDTTFETMSAFGQALYSNPATVAKWKADALDKWSRLSTDEAKQLTLNTEDAVLD